MGTTEARLTEQVSKTEYRLGVLNRLKSSPVVAAVFEAVKTNSDRKPIVVGISTEKAVKEGQHPSICILFNVSQIGHLRYNVDPPVCAYKRLDVIPEDYGLDRLRFKVEGNMSNHSRDIQPLPYTEADLSSLQKAIGDRKPRPEVSVVRYLDNFPAPGFEKLSPSST